MKVKLTSSDCRSLNFAEGTGEIPLTKYSTRFVTVNKKKTNFRTDVTVEEFTLHRQITLTGYGSLPSDQMTLRSGESIIELNRWLRLKSHILEFSLKSVPLQPRVLRYGVLCLVI